MNAVLSVHGRDLLIKTGWNQRAIDELKKNGSEWDKDRRVWVAPATTWGLVHTVRALRAAGVEVSADTWAKEAIAKANRAQALFSNGHNLEDLGLTTKPYHHQRVGLELIRLLDSCYLAQDMGVGKSKQVVDATTILKMKSVLIACPKSVIPAWQTQFETHGDGRMKCVQLRKGSIAKRLQLAKQALASGPVALIINHEAVWREPFGSFVAGIFWDMVVVDEAHRIAGMKSKVSEFFADLGWKAVRRVALSGTPIPNNPLGLFAQMRFLDEGVFGRNFKRFKSKYCKFGGFKKLPAVCFKCKQPVVRTKGLRGECTGCGKVYEARAVEVVGYQNLDEMHDRFYRLAHRVKKEDVLDLPETTDQTLNIVLSDPELSAYKEMEDKLIAEVDEGTITAANGMVKLLRLQQITGGAANDEDGNSVLVGTSKRDALIEHLGDLPPDEPVVVFCRFTHDIASVGEACAAAGRQFRELSGNRNELAEWQTVDSVSHDGNGSVLAVQISSGGVGVDLTRSRYAMYYSLGFSLAEYEQSRARLHRIGQGRNVLYTHLVAEDTVDEKVYFALKSKLNVAEHVLRHLR